MSRRENKFTMNIIIDAVIGIMSETWFVLNESALWVLIGFAMAALVKVFVPDDMVAKYLGKNGVGGVFRAALFGIPLPLCSCGVIPAAMGLKKQGASRGAVVSFLVSTPETGVDSIALTWALFDPIMTIARPVTAFISAMTAGLLENFLGPKETVSQAVEAVGCCAGCCSSEIPVPNPPKKRFSVRLRESFDYAFGDLLSDIGKWLFIGLLLAGIISYFIPDSFLEAKLGHGIVPMLIMLAIGIPLYICATASTPLAAALVLKGLSPGAALVFLIAGPATNVTTITLLYKMLGKRSLAIYLGSIMVSALLCGIALDWVYLSLGIKIAPAIATGVGEELSGWFSYLCSVILIGLILWNIIRDKIKPSTVCR